MGERSVLWPKKKNKDKIKDLKNTEQKSNNFGYYLTFTVILLRLSKRPSNVVLNSLLQDSSYPPQMILLHLIKIFLQASCVHGVRELY